MQALQKSGVQIVGYKPIAYGQEDIVYPDYQKLATDDYDAKDNSDVLTLMQ